MKRFLRICAFLAAQWKLFEILYSSNVRARMLALESAGLTIDIECNQFPINFLQNVILCCGSLVTQVFFGTWMIYLADFDDIECILRFLVTCSALCRILIAQLAYLKSFWGRGGEI